MVLGTALGKNTQDICKNRVGVSECWAGHRVRTIITLCWMLVAAYDLRLYLSPHSPSASPVYAVGLVRDTLTQLRSL